MANTSTGRCLRPVHLLPRAESARSEARRQGFFRVRLVGRAADGTRVDAELSGAGDPANTATVTMVCESALCIALARDSLPGGPRRGGLLTPATAFGPVLADRLRAVGMRVEILTGEG